MTTSKKRCRSARRACSACTILLAMSAVTACTGQPEPSANDLAASPTRADAPSSGGSRADTEPCFNPYGGMCLGRLDPGTYTTQVYEPTIRYTVPDGWVNGEDLPGNFLLYREEDPQEGFEGGSYIGIYTDIRAPKRCQEAWADGVGHTPADLARWYVQHPGLAASRPRRVEVGGLQGLMVDVPLHEEWQGRCPWSQGDPVVPVIIGSGVSELHHVSGEGLSVRLLLLSWNDTNVTIEITSVEDQHSRAEYLEMASPIIKSLRFDG